MRRAALLLLVSLCGFASSSASATTARPMVRITYATPKVSPRGVLTVRVSVRPPATSCKLALHGPHGRLIRLPAKHRSSGALEWTYRVPASIPAGSWKARAACGKARSAARSFTVEAPVLKANVLVASSGFTQSNYTSSTGTDISYGAVLRNSTSNVDALNVAVAVSFTDTLGRSVATQTTILTGIPAGGTFYLGGLASSNVSLTVANMSVSVTIGSTQAHRLTLPAVSGLDAAPDNLGDESVSGMFSNPYSKATPSTAQIYVVYLNSQGTVVGGASEFADAAVNPGSSVVFGFGDFSSEINTSFVQPSSVASIEGSVDPCGSGVPGLGPLVGASCPAQVPAQS